MVEETKCDQIKRKAEKDAKGVAAMKETKGVVRKHESQKKRRK